MSVHNFDIDKHALDKELRDRIRAVINGLINDPVILVDQREMLRDTLTNLQPSDTGTNIIRLEIGASTHWDNKIYSNRSAKVSCALVLLRQLIINYWDYLLEGSDESLASNGRIEDHLETLEGYVEHGLENYIVVGNIRTGYFLMWTEEYRKAMEGCR